MAETPLSPIALEQKRELAIARLCDHFARDDIGVEELERLIDRAHRALTVAELKEVLAELPSQPAPQPVAALPAQGEARAQQLIVAVMGGAQRRGGWTPARTVYVVAVMGGALLDFRQARLAEGVTDVVVVAIMGGVEIIVPPELRVESDGIGIMGGFDHAGRAPEPARAEGPTLQVSGVALMGGVEIRERSRADPTDPRTLDSGRPGSSPQLGGGRARGHERGR